MRIWHYQLLSYLPDKQFKGQLRELVAIMHDWRDKGETNHLLINRVMDYPKDELSQYFWEYAIEYNKRYGKNLDKYIEEFNLFSLGTKKALRPFKRPLFDGWHNAQYLDVCIANLFEKYHFGKGKSKINNAEWKILFDGYKSIVKEIKGITISAVNYCINDEDIISGKGM